MFPFDLGSECGRASGVDRVAGVDLGARDRLNDVFDNADCNMVAGLAGMSYWAGVIPSRSSMRRS